MYNLPLGFEVATYLYIFLSVPLLVWVLLLNLSNKDKKLKARDRKYSSFNELTKEFMENESYRHSLRLIDEARMKSLKIVADSRVFDDSAKQDIKDKLDRIFDAQIASLQEVSQQMMSKYVDLISAEIESFKDTLRKGTLATTKKVDAQVQADYTQVKADLDAYKNQKIEKIDDTIYAILSETMSEILGKVLSLQEHEELIFKILEDAKKRAKFEV